MFDNVREQKLTELLTEFNDSGLRVLSDQQKRLDALEIAMQRGDYSAGGGDDGEAKAAFAAFARRGDESGLRQIEAKALSVNREPDGGFAVPEEIDRRIEELLRDISPIRSIATVTSVGTAELTILVSAKGTQSGWVGETEDRPKTETPELKRIKISTAELFANPVATQKLLDDSSFDAAAWLESEIAEEFAVQEGQAFVAGTGVGQPRGFLQYPISTAGDSDREFGTLQYLASGVDGAWPSNAGGDDSLRADLLIDVVHSLRPRYRSGAVWVMNSNTLASVRKFKDADGAPIFQPSLREGQPSQLLGFRMVEAEDMPNIASNSLSVAFGNFQRGYRIADRTGLRLLRDPFSAKPNVQFYATKRVGGGVVNSEAIKLLRFSAS